VATRKRPTKTADAVILDTLRGEFEFHDHTAAEEKIRRRLRYYRAGPYEQTRVDLLRRLKNQVRDELQRVLHGGKSRYFVAPRGAYTAMEDIDGERLTRDLCESYPKVPPEEIAAFIPGAVYYYYLR
jgi:hypothetical protein